MGHKVHPKIFRTGTLYPWDSRWFGRKGKYKQYLQQEVALREYLEKKLRDAGLDGISVARNAKDVTVTLLVAKPGIIIGRGGAGIEELKKTIKIKFFDRKDNVKVQVYEVKDPSLSSKIVGNQMKTELEKRVPFRRVMKQAIQRVMQNGAKGVKISIAGRLNGADIARRETLSDGKIPLSTLRADVDYALVEANTIYGVIGIKVWIYRGQVFGRKDKFAREDTKF